MRVLTLPRAVSQVVFNDSSLAETMRRYKESTGRTQAVYLDSNIEYLAKANAMTGPQEVADTFCSADWYVVSRSFFAGLPMMGPFSQRGIFSSQKYKCVLLSLLSSPSALPDAASSHSPTRTFTPAGSLGLAGVMSAIYPVDSPGGYQLLGKTLTPFSPWGRYEAAGGSDYEAKFLLRNFDVVHWLPLEEDEFLKVRLLSPSLASIPRRRR